MIEVTRVLAGWDAMHRVPRHESKCRAFHGHRYSAEVTCTAPELDACGRVVDFGVIAAKVGGWVQERWDHTAILQTTDPDPAVLALVRSNAHHGRPVYLMNEAPTAENMAAELARVAQQLLEADGLRVVRVRIYETPNCWADWTP